ncbi:unnamed protein product, partial [Durusdinium trenchii]
PLHTAVVPWGANPSVARWAHELVAEMKFQSDLEVKATHLREQAKMLLCGCSQGVLLQGVSTDRSVRWRSTTGRSTELLLASVCSCSDGLVLCWCRSEGCRNDWCRPALTAQATYHSVLLRPAYHLDGDG